MATQLVELALALLLLRLFLNKSEKIPAWMHWSAGAVGVLLVIDPLVTLLNWVRHWVPLS